MAGLAAAFGQAAERMRMHTYHEDDASVSLSSTDAEVYVDPTHTEVYVEHTHPQEMLAGLNRLRLNRVLCDVVLCCGGQEFPCHRHVLASFSPYFEAMFTSGMVESTQERVTISAVEPEVFGMLVNYAYTSEVSISAANVQALLAASNLLDFMAIRVACCDYMKRHMDISNCVGIYRLAEAQCCERLAEYSMDYILEHFSDIYLQEEFLSLSVEELTVILASDHLHVPKEDMVFKAAMLWLNKCPTRRQNFEKVLEQVRLPLISPSYRHTVIECLDVVKENQGCQRFISEAKDQPFCNTARPRRTTVIVIVGGEDSLGRRQTSHSNEVFNRIECFDPLNNRWKTLGRLPWKAERSAVVKSVGSTLLYLAGGEVSDNRDLKNMFKYEVSPNLWMNNSQSFFRLVMLDGYVYRVAGRGDWIEKYNPDTDSWICMHMEGVSFRRRCLSTRCLSNAVVALGGHLYIIGGNPSCSMHKEAKYNPETSVLTEVAPMHNPRAFPAVLTLNGKIYVIGGEHYSGVNGNNTIPLNLMECYNPKTNQWTTCAPMQVRRTEHNAVEVDGKIYVLGGKDENHRLIQNIERYCEETDTWETAGEMPNVRAGFSCMSFKLRKDLLGQ